MASPFLDKKPFIQCGDDILVYRLDKLIDARRILCDDMSKPQRERLIRLR
jgi:hypothetical protein